MTKLPFWLARRHMAARNATCQGCGAAHENLEPITLHSMELICTRVHFRVGVRCQGCGHTAVWAGVATVPDKLIPLIEEN